MGWYDDHDEKGLESIVGKAITDIYMDDDYLVFIAADGTVHGFMVEGDCCSHSYFHDFHGVEKLYQNGVVKEVGAIDLDEIEGRIATSNQFDYDEVVAYGFKIVTESPVWGEQTSVFSFRNSSNGYYGGWMYKTDHIPNDFCSEKNRLTQDKL